MNTQGILNTLKKGEPIKLFNNLTTINLRPENTGSLVVSTWLESSGANIEQYTGDKEVLGLLKKLDQKGYSQRRKM